MNFGAMTRDQRDGALSVGEVNRYVKMLMDNDSLLSSVCVIGEISNLKYHSSGHPAHIISTVIIGIGVGCGSLHDSFLLI